jgi:hypothetical protein
LARNRMRAPPRTASRASLPTSSHLPADTVFLMGRLAEHHVKETGARGPGPRLAQGPQPAREGPGREDAGSEGQIAAVRCETCADQRSHGRAASCPGGARTRARVRAADPQTLAVTRPHAVAAHPARHRLRT